MFKEKGIVLKSAISENVKITLALFENDTTGELSFLAKPTIRRLNKSGKFNTNLPYKAWHNARELAALQALLTRAQALMDEYAEGTLNLTDILAEDEDARMFTRTEGVMYPTIDGAFTMDEGKAEVEESEPQSTGVIEVDPNDHF